MLSIADLLLSVMWIVGGAIWMTGGLHGPHHNRVSCFIILLITVVSWGGKSFCEGAGGGRSS